VGENSSLLLQKVGENSSLLLRKVGERPRLLAVRGREAQATSGERRRGPCYTRCEEEAHATPGVRRRPIPVYQVRREAHTRVPGEEGGPCEASEVLRPM